jgi:nicotine blue oxidoreductase
VNADLVCAILAAGAASRFGSPKTALAFGEHSFVERALKAARDYPTVIVVAANDDTAAHAAVRFGASVVVNDARERGMSHSLRLANSALSAPDAWLAVLLVDTPLVDADVVRRVFAAAQHTDIAFPVSPDGRPGHPVVFGARARHAIERLPDGDTIRTLRDDPRFSRTPLRFEDERPFTDVDTPADYRAIF